STIPGLFVLGEANFSDHGANRLGASALMQGLADGYFIIPYTMGDYLATARLSKVAPDHAEVKRCEAEVGDRIKKLLAVRGKKAPLEFHRQLGKVLWDDCGMTRSEQSLKRARAETPRIREEFWRNVAVSGSDDMNPTLERACRLADFLEFAEL